VWLRQAPVGGCLLQPLDLILSQLLLLLLLWVESCQEALW
jgi:hypothetical protein